MIDWHGRRTQSPMIEVYVYDTGTGSLDRFQSACRFYGWPDLALSFSIVTTLQPGDILGGNGVLFQADSMHDFKR